MPFFKSEGLAAIQSWHHGSQALEKRGGRRSESPVITIPRKWPNKENDIEGVVFKTPWNQRPGEPRADFRKGDSILPHVLLRPLLWTLRPVHRVTQIESVRWLWVKNRVPPKWNPGKWKQGLKPAVPCWFNFDPYPDSVSFKQSPPSPCLCRACRYAMDT